MADERPADSPVKHTDFGAISMRVVHEIEQTKPNALLLFRRLPEGIVKSFDAEPSFLPFDPELPSAVPFLTLVNAAKGTKLIFTRKKVDITWLSLVGPIPVDKVPLGEVMGLISEVHGALGYAIKKLGFVFTTVAYAEQPAAVLIERFCASPWKAEATSSQPYFAINLHANDRVAGRFDVHAWAKFSEGAEEPSGRKVIHLESDINTGVPKSNDARFNTSDTSEFYPGALKLVQERIKYLWS